MSWLFSQALVEEYSEGISLDGAQSAQSSGKPTQQAYCAPDKMTAFSRLSRFGMTYKPLTATHGEALLMSYLAAFPAKTFQPQGGGAELQGPEAQCGNTWPESLTKFDLSSCSWKTHQCSLLGDLELFSGTWPKWGLMRNGESWAQTSLVQRIGGTEFGWLPTPTATDWMTGKVNGIEHRNRRFIRTSLTSGTEFGANLRDAFRLMTGKALPPNFSEWMMGWPIGWTDLKPLEMDKFQ